MCADTLDKSIHPAAGGVCVCACASYCETINNSARRSWAINTSLICGVRARDLTLGDVGDHPEIDHEHLNSPQKVLVCAECIELPPNFTCCERVREDTEIIAFAASIERFIATVGLTSKRLLCAAYFDVIQLYFGW